MSSESLNRRAKRAQARKLASMGIDPRTMFVRYDIEPEVVAAALEAGSEVDIYDAIAQYVVTGMRALKDEGGDVLGHTVVTLGVPPNAAELGIGLRIEVKTLTASE